MTQRADTPGHPGGPGAPPEVRTHRRTFWATTGIATIVAAVIGAIATVLAGKGPDERPPAVPASTVAPAAGAAPGPATTGPATTAAAASGIFWQGSFVFHTYVDFDSAPPQNDAGELTQDVKGNLLVYNDGSVWTGAAPPTKEQCADQIATRATDQIPLDAGTRVCYRTEGGRVVYFEVTELVEEGGLLATPRYELDVVVWRR
jgi:hypothetical protein